MLEPSKKDIQEVRKLELEREAEATSAVYGLYVALAASLGVLIERALNGSELVRRASVARAQRQSQTVFIRSFDDVRRFVIAAHNAAIFEQRFLVEKTLGTRVDWRQVALASELPSGRDYAITRRVLNSRAVNIRSAKVAAQIARLIENGQRDGIPIPEVTKQIERVLGVRDNQGKRVFLRKADILKGAPIPRNGMLYQVTRIARTEMMRAASLEANNVFREVQRENPDARLRLRAVIDSRTRQQSIMMNGQLSDEKGRFKYPDGVYYKLGDAPARWSINDRETSYPVFLEAERGSSADYDNVSDYLQTRAFDITAGVT